MYSRLFAASIGLLLLTACGGPRLAPIMRNGDFVPNTSAAAVQRARAQGEAERERLGQEGAYAAGTALASCLPAACEAIVRGELALGMTEAEVLAATRTTAETWRVQPGPTVTVMTVRPGGPAQRDAVGEISYIALQNGRVSSYTYREPSGFRTVNAAVDASMAARRAALADELLRQGDEMVAAGRLDLALERYDRADVILPESPETTLRIATTLDKQLRPIEAVLRYQAFIHQLEIEKINARGEAAARMAEAIARAHERIIVLERTAQ